MSFCSEGDQSELITVKHLATSINISTPQTTPPFFQTSTSLNDKQQAPASITSHHNRQTLKA